MLLILAAGTSLSCSSLVPRFFACPKEPGYEARAVVDKVTPAVPVFPGTASSFPCIRMSPNVRVMHLAPLFQTTVDVIPAVLGLSREPVFDTGSNGFS